MRKIKLLDCTLRDGGYVNQWKFGEKIICQIISKLDKAGVEVIECGYLNENVLADKDSTIYNSADTVIDFCNKYPNREFACMINIGEYSIESITKQKLPPNFILRIAFHKRDIKKAILYSETLIKKGYRVILQPMCVGNYNDIELLQLIHTTNDIKPEAFYIVDSFGTLEIKDFRRILFMADHNLNRNIQLGYHSHDNKKQAYSNAQDMVNKLDDREILIDASIFGMGRGAGNLNEELFAEFLNNIYGKSYNMQSMFEVMDLYINRIYLEKPWGYQLSYYLSAKHNCHPNYATYFSNKNSLMVTSLNEIFQSMTMEEKSSYSEEKAEMIYDRYQNQYVDDTLVRNRLAKEWKNKVLLMLGPGKSIQLYKDKIQEFIKESSPIVIALNFIPEYFKYTYVMCTNLKRWNGVKNVDTSKLIVSSNINNDSDGKIVLNYETIKCGRAEISDNVMIMLLHLLIQLGVEKVYCAGVDGFSGIMTENYVDFTMSLGANAHLRYEKNSLMIEEIEECRKSIKINFITPSKYDN